MAIAVWGCDRLLNLGINSYNILESVNNKEPIAALTANIGCQNLHSCRSLQSKGFWRFLAIDL
jgi:hypothetical protein